MSVSRRSILATLRKIQSLRDTLQDQLDYLQNQFDELSDTQQDSKRGLRLVYIIFTIDDILSNLDACTADDLGGDL